MSGTAGDLTEDVLVADRYRVHEKIGAGGMGVVFRATDTRLKRQVALKRVLLRDVDDDRAAEIRHRTLREAEIAARVHHPRIVSIFDVLDDAGGPLLVLEYLPSQSLGELVARGDVLTPGAAARAGAQVAEALAAAHAAGIVHRDVKPGNVLAGPGDPLGPVKLADFGISHVPETSTLTSEGIGTPAYFAPEIARGERPTPASDVYALGATLCAVVQGAPPYGWGTGNPLELIRRIGQDPVPAPTIGGPLGDVIAGLTADDPAARPRADQAAATLWQLADRYEPAHPVAPAPPPPPGGDGLSDPTLDGPGHGGRPWYRRRTVLAGAGVLLAAVVAGGALVATSGPDPAPPGAVPATIPALTIGDERTADPCSFVRAEALQRFGAPTLVPDYGFFGSCQFSVRLGPEDADEIDVVTRLGTATSGVPEGDQQRLGDGLVIRTPLQGDVCARSVVLSDGTPIGIEAGYDGPRRPAPDLCAVAEAAAGSAATTLATAGVARRDLPPGALWTTDACRLLTPADLPFFSPDQREPSSKDAGRWGCRWDGGDQSARIEFDRYDPPSETGTAVPGTPAFTRPDGDDACNAEVPTRSFLSSNTGRSRADVLRVKVEGAAPVQPLCDRAAALVTAAAGRVPR